MDLYNSYKIQIYYPGITFLVDESEFTDLARPNLRYMLNDMQKVGHHLYCLTLSSEGNKNEVVVEYKENEMVFAVKSRGTKTDFFAPKECLDKLCSIVTEWANLKNEEEN